MAVDYTTATTVDVNEGVNSQDYNRLALAFNDRLKNGVADPTWRLLWYAHSLVRGMRNPNGLTYAPEDEWWKVYAHIKEASGVTWPTAAAGEPEGINVSNPLGAFIYGMSPTIDNEEGRINGSGQFDPAGTTLASAPTGVPLFINDGSLRAPANITDYWTLAKYQRGAVASDLSDYSASNAIKASQEHGNINYSDSHFYLKNYGGFLPSPTLDASDPLCGDGYTPNYDLKFTNLVGGSDKTYSTCPPTGVMFYFEGFTSYKIVKWNGSTVSLPLTDYIEGPYDDNAYLRRYKGQQINQAMNWFAMEYRSNETERATSDMNRIIKGFQFQDFLTKQYSLAPAFGSVSTGTITAVYPTFDISGPQSANAYLPVTTSGTYSGGTYYTVPAKFTFAGYFAKITGAGAGSATIKVIDSASGSDVVLETFTITAGGTDKRLRYFPSAHNEAKIRFQLSENLPSGIGVNIECAMLLEYKPTIYDSYVCLRLGSTDGPLDTNYDKSGYTFSDPKQISDNILEYGCIIRNVAGIPTNTGEINENPVYESARRLIQNNLRMSERQQLVGYEVIGGKSYIHFKRFARGRYSEDIDVFSDIAPPADYVTSGNLIEGEQYQVWSAGGSGTITYNGSGYGAITSGGHSGGEQSGTFFTATSVKTFTTSGDATVRVRNGIRTSPIKDNRSDRFRGQTNEWLSQMSTAVYKLSDSSIYKPDSYADIMGFLTDRCGLLSCAWSRQGGCTGFSAQAEVNNFVNYGSKMSLRPENPSGYRYILGSHGPTSLSPTHVNSMVDSLNTPSDKVGDKKHYESCQIYRPDLELEAVYIDPTSFYAGQDYNVIVKLNGRLDNETAPSSITNTSSGWYAAFTGSYVPTRRTDENAVLEYLYHIASYGSGSISDYNCIQKIGDIAYDANAASGYYSNDFHGNCYPRFYFSKQVRHVWNDENVTYDAADSLTTVDEMLYMEFVLQAISSGFIDKESSVQLSCTGTGRYYDYTFPNLCYQALKMTKSNLPSEAVTRATNTFTWDAVPNVLYTLVGVDGSGNETLIESSVTSPLTKTGVASFTSYKAYAGSNNKDNRTVVDFNVSYSGSDNVITFTEDSAANVKYFLLGRAAPSTLTEGNSASWSYWTGSAWTATEANAASVSSPITIPAASVKGEYRVESLVYGRKKWFEFLPATLRPDNAQGFGPLPNTNLYARIFNNVCNAVNLLTRARIDLPFTYQTREGEATYLATPTSGTGTTTNSILTSSRSYPFDYSCSQGTTILADNAGGLHTTVEMAGATFGGSAVTDRGLPTAAGGWGTSICDAKVNMSFGPFEATCNSGTIKGGTMAGTTFTDGGNTYYQFNMISRKYNGEFRAVDSDIKLALPVGIRDQFLANPGFIGYTQHHLTKYKKDSGGTLPTNGGVPFTGGQKYSLIEKDIYICDFFESDVKLDASLSPLYDDFKTADLYYDQRGTNDYSQGGDADLTLTFYPFTDKPSFIKIPLVSQNYPNNTY